MSRIEELYNKWMNLFDAEYPHSDSIIERYYFDSSDEDNVIWENYEDSLAFNKAWADRYNDSRIFCHKSFASECNWCGMTKDKVHKEYDRLKNGRKKLDMKNNVREQLKDHVQKTRSKKRACRTPAHVSNYTDDPLRYMSKRQLAHEKKIKNLMYMGIEFETKLASGSFLEDTVAEITQDTLRNIAMIKDDSSITCGFEIVTTPCSYAFHMKGTWDSFFERTAPKLKLDSSCGLHVHVSKSAISPLQIAKVAKFIHAPDNVEFLNRIAGRSTNSYCARKDFNLKNIIRTGTINFERSEVLNGRKPNTWEFRFLAPSKKQDVFLSRIQFVKALLDFAQRSRSSEMTSEHFVRWLKSNQYNYLNAILAEDITQCA